jgi:hypothetical protein
VQAYDAQHLSALLVDGNEGHGTGRIVVDELVEQRVTHLAHRREEAQSQVRRCQVAEKIRIESSIGIPDATGPSISTCARWQLMCSSSGMRRLRLREGKASKSRLRGQFDEAFLAIRTALGFRRHDRSQRRSCRRQSPSSLAKTSSRKQTPIVSLGDTLMGSRPISTRSLRIRPGCHVPTRSSTALTAICYALRKREK